MNAHMLQFIFLILTSMTGHASQLKIGVFPGVGYSGQSIAVFRADTVLLFGTDTFSAGVYGGYHNFSPQTVDNSYGLALHAGHDYYFEMQAGIFSRAFQQLGTDKLTGSGYSANLILGMTLNSFVGLDLTLSGKRIASGSLDRRTIIDLLPLIALRAEF